MRPASAGLDLRWLLEELQLYLQEGSQTDPFEQVILCFHCLRAYAGLPIFFNHCLIVSFKDEL